MKPIQAITLLLTLLPGVGVRLSAQTDQGILTTVAQIRSLSAAEAGKQHPVKLRGVVTFYDDGLFSRFIQDDTAGIYLQVTNALTLKPGQIVELEGVTGPGEFAPVVLPSTVKVTGNGKLPAARPVTSAQLLSGVEDSQFVEIQGDVRSVRFEKSTGDYYLDIVTGGERFTVVAKQIPLAKPDDLLAATVRVRGVCATLFNRQRQLFGVRLLVPNAEGLVVERPAPNNPFDAAAQPIDDLLKFTPEDGTQHRVKVKGTVTYFEPGNAIFIEDGRSGLYCQTAMRDPLKPGDQVEVLGSPAKGEYTPVLEDAIYRKLGTGAEPAPEPVDLNEVLTGQHDCRLVQMTAKILERVDRGVNQFLLLSAGDFVFQAYLPANANSDQLAGLANGSDVRLTGICLIERGNNWQAGKDWRAKSFRLLLRSPQDVQVVTTVRESSPEYWLLIIGAMELVVLIVIIRLAMYVRRHRAATN